MNTELLIFIGVVVFSLYLMKKNNEYLDKKLKGLKGEDAELALRSKNVGAEIVDIKRELAEKSLGVKNMSSKEVEDFWKNKG